MYMGVYESTWGLTGVYGGVWEHMDVWDGEKAHMVTNYTGYQSGVNSKITQTK